MKNNNWEKLYQVNKNFHQMGENLDDAITKGLEIMIQTFNLDRITILLSDETESSLRPVQTVTATGAIEGEGEIILNSKRNDPYDLVISGRYKLVVRGKPEYSVYFPLVDENKIFGLIKAENVFKEQEIIGEDIEGLESFAEVFSMNIKEIISRQREKMLTKHLFVLNRVINAIVGGMQFEKVVELILSLMVSELDFDRAKLYLVDNKKNILKGVKYFDIHHKIESCKDETYPLDENKNPLVDIFLNRLNHIFSKESVFSNYIYAMPIYAGNEKIGLFLVYSILTEHEISKWDIEMIKILADCAGLAAGNLK